jgi:hypothetical protein
VSLSQTELLWTLHCAAQSEAGNAVKVNGFSEFQKIAISSRTEFN